MRVKTAVQVMMKKRRDENGHDEKKGMKTVETENAEGKKTTLENEKGGHHSGSQARKLLLAVIHSARHALCHRLPGTGELDRSALPLPHAHSPEVRPPCFWPGSIRHLLPARENRRLESDSTFSLTPD